MSSVSCTSEDEVDRAEGACADFASEVSGNPDSSSLSEPSTIGEMRELLVDAGAQAPSEWDELNDDDLVAQCTYNVADDGESPEDLVECPDRGQSGQTLQATYLVDETGHGVFIGSAC